MTAVFTPMGGKLNCVWVTMFRWKSKRKCVRLLF